MVASFYGNLDQIRLMCHLARMHQTLPYLYKNRNINELRTEIQDVTNLQLYMSGPNLSTNNTARLIVLHKK